METFRSELFSKGVIDSAQTGSGWVTQFDCLYFTEAFQVLAEEQYAKESFHDFVVAPSLAIVKVNYVRDTDAALAKSQGWQGSMFEAKAPPQHSIVAIITEKGLMYLDPQIGPVTLSHNEINYIQFRLAN